MRTDIILNDFRYDKYMESEFYLLLGISISLFITELLIAFYLSKQVGANKNRLGPSSGNFITKVFIMIIFYILGHFCFILLDFYFTKFSLVLYVITPNIWIYKIGIVITGIGSLPLLFFLDKQILNLKLKGIPILLLILVLFLIFLYPVSNLMDFESLSLITSFVHIGPIIISIIFIYIASKCSGDKRKFSVLIFLGLFTYILLGLFNGVYVILGKIPSLVLFVWGASKFRFEGISLNLSSNTMDFVKVLDESYSDWTNNENNREGKKEINNQDGWNYTN